MHRLLVHADQLSIHYNLIELRFYSGNELIQYVAEREVGAVTLKERAANLWKGCAVKNQLRSKNADGIGNVARFGKRSRCRRRSGQRHLNVPDLRGGRFEKGGSPRRTSRRRTCPTRRSENPRALQIGVSPFIICPRVDLRQGLRADLNDDPFGSF